MLWKKMVELEDPQFHSTNELYNSELNITV